MDKKRKVYGNTLCYQKRRRKTRSPGMFGVLLLAGILLLCKMTIDDLEGMKNDLKEVVAPAVEKIDLAIETLGHTFLGQDEINEHAVLVFGRMILGLDEEKSPKDDAEDEQPQSCDMFEHMTESVSPIMNTAQLAEQWAESETDDCVVNCTFEIPSPDIVDDRIYTVSIPFCMPLKGYRVTSSFGYRIHPISGNTTFHYGADLAAQTGVSVVAIADGTVVETGYGNINGNYVKVAHTDGYVSHYTHLHTIHVIKGQKLTAGQRLGTVGSSGYSTGPHLHFELRKDGKILDPFEYFSF